MGPQTAPGSHTGSPYPYHPSCRTTRTSSCLPAAPLPTLHPALPPFDLVTLATGVRVTHRVLHHHCTRQGTSRLSARATSRGTSRGCCPVFPQHSKNTTSQVLRGSAVHRVSIICRRKQPSPMKCCASSRPSTARLCLRSSSHIPRT